MTDAPTEVIPVVPAAGPPDAVSQEPSEVRPDEDLSAKAADLEDELAKVRAAAFSGDVIRLKVEEPHVGFALGHINVGADFTEVPAGSVAAIMEGAANSGVTITQEEV